MKNVALIAISDSITYENGSVALLESLFSNQESEEYAGVLIWINSGGGSFCAAQDMAAMLQRSMLPSIAVVGELCASAAYYIALATHRIISRPASLVGGLCASIDVNNCSMLNKKIGIQHIAHANGKMKQMLSPYTDTPGEDEASAIKDILDDLDQEFYSFIDKRRPQGLDLRSYFDGRLLSGKRAFKVGLVDELGGLYEATQALKRMLGSEDIKTILLEPVDEASTNVGAYEV